MILFLGLLFLGSFLYKISSDIKNEYIVEQRNITKISANSINSIFLQYEMMLDILGQQLVKNDNYKNTENSRKTLDNLLEVESAVIAFGLAKPNGKLYVTSSNLKNTKKLPNLFEKKETKESFAYTLEEDVMVIGRSYYHKVLKTLIIPIRKSIKDSNGNVISVMTAGINVNKTFGLLSNTMHNTFIFRDFDYFYQLTQKKDNYDIYKKAVSSNYVNEIFKIISKKENLPIKIIKSNEILITSQWNNYISNYTKKLSTLKYINRYGLWIITQIDSNTIQKDILKKALSFVAAYIIIMIILFVLFKNIDENEKKKKNALYYQATHDYLTKLNNRFYLSKEFEKIKHLKPFTLLFIDLDNFKSVNDNYGHKYGDLVLKEVTKRLHDFKKNDDVLVRYSGDEFILITYKIEKSEIKKLANEIINKLNQTYTINQYHFNLGASIGISQYPLDADTFDEVKRYSDIAMYEAKKEKNSFKIFEDSIKHKYLEASKIEEGLKKAVHKNEIYMVYQPQVRKDGTLYGVEALVRWENETLGFIPPSEFIKIAEDTGIMPSLGKHIIKTSIKEIQEVKKKLNQNFQLSINISIKQFIQTNFNQSLINYIEKLNFPKFQLTIEVTESVFIEDIKYILNCMDKLKQSNIKISLDDFGTGYSSLNLLRKLPIDELKIDKSFIDDITKDENSLAMASSIIAIGKKFNMTILAEGIETLEQKELLDEYNCDLYQGYYYSKPLKKDDLIKYILEKHS